MLVRKILLATQDLATYISHVYDVPRQHGVNTTCSGIGNPAQNDKCVPFHIDNRVTVLLKHDITAKVQSIHLPDVIT